jgi:hypothetical protein
VQEYVATLKKYYEKRLYTNPSLFASFFYSSIREQNRERGHEPRSPLEETGYADAVITVSP